MTSTDFGGFGLYPPGNRTLTGYNVGTLTEVEYREWLDSTFKPIFEPFEKLGGIPCKELLARFQFNNHGLPRDRRNELILRMDANRDGRINYQEFRATLVKIRYIDLSPQKRFGIRAILAFNPGLRLKAARTRAAEHLRSLEAVGRTGAQPPVPAEDIPIPDRGGLKQKNGFRLESDGIWPTAMRRQSAAGRDSPSPTIIEADLEYIPDSYLKAYNCVPPPIFIPLMVLVQLAVFIYYAVELNRRALSEPKNVLTWTSGFPYFSPLYFDPRRRREVWRFFTYIFVHQGIWHILFNSIVTLVFGVLVEWVHKFWRVAPIYLAGVLAGSLTCSILDPFAILAGSSGGTYALVGVHLALVAMNWEEMQHDCTSMRSKLSALSVVSSGIFRVSLIVTLVCIDFGLALYRRYALQTDLMVSISAHLAGFLAGLLVGITLLRNFNEKPWERILFWISIALCTAFIFFAIIWNIFWPNFPKQLV